MKRRLSTILAAFSLMACVTCVISWAFHLAEASYQSKGGLVFSLQAEHLTDSFSLTLGWPVGPPVVDDHGRFNSPIPYSITHPPAPSRNQWHRFMLERGQWSIDADDWLGNQLDPPNAPSAYLVNVFGRPHRYVLFRWPRVATGLFAIPFAVPPALWTHARLRRRTVNGRQSAGLCVSCGYDLRTQLAATSADPAEPSRCPECGTALPEAKRTTAPTPTIF